MRGKERKQMSDSDKSPVTTRDVMALSPEAVVMFAADCVETACRFFEGCDYIVQLKGNLPDAVWNTIRAVRQNPYDIAAISGARDVAARLTEWINTKSRSDVRHIDSRYDDTRPDEDDAYKTLYLICRAAVALAEPAAALARSESPVIPAKETADLLMQVSIAFAGATNYWHDDYAREIGRIRGEAVAEIRSHLVNAARRT